MKVEQWPIDKPILYARNPRKIGDNAIAKVAASIKEYGFRQPIVVDKEGVVVVGHTRLAAAQKLGLETVPVHVADDITPQQAKAYRLADNRTGEETEWDVDLLALELSELAELDFDLENTGFSEMEIDSFLGEPAEDPAKQWEGMPEFQHEDQTSIHKVIVHFATMADLDAFSKLVSQTVTDRTKSIWYPKAEIGHYADKRYEVVEDQESDAA